MLPVASPPKAGAARIIVVVAAVNGGIEIKPVVEPGRVQPASSTIDIDMTARAERGPGMRIVAHHADRQLIGDAIVDPQADSAGGEVVALGIPVAVHTDKVTESSHPDAPTIFRGVLEDRFHDRFGGFSVRVGSDPPDSPWRR